MTAYDVAAILDRITYEPTAEAAKLSPIPWPAGLKPEPQQTALTKDGTLPACQILIVTWTAAEAMALADVLTPGVPSSDWLHYARDFAAYEPQLTTRSPAKEARRLGEFHLTDIGGVKVGCYHSQLHPATDGPTLPTAQMAAQIAGDTGATLVITTGTAGGVGDGVTLGDVNIGITSSSLFSTRLKGKPWSKETWQTTPLTAAQKVKLAPDVLNPLFAANAGRLPKEWAPRAPQVWYGDGVSTDFFAVGDLTDHYGLLAYRRDCRAVDMDDAAICFGLSQMKDAPGMAVIRNASDPTMPGATAADLKLAKQIYKQYGFVTTAFSAIACWAIIAGLTQD